MQRLAHEVGGTPVESALRRVGDSLSDALVGTRAGRIVWATARLAEMTGERDVTGFLGLPLDALFDESGEGMPSVDPDHIVECLLRRGDGGEARVAVRCLGDGEDDGPDRVWLLEDVSRLRLLETELLRASRDLHAANREIASLRERMRRELADREELLTVVSHELRTPVTVILGYGRLLLSGKVGELNDEQRRFLGETQKSCQRLNAFIGNLLETARSLTGDTVLEVSEIPVSATKASRRTRRRPLARHFRRQGIALLELAGELDNAIPVAGSLACPQFQAEGGDMTSLLALKPAKHGQRFIEAAQLVHHLGFQHQRRRFIA